MTDKTEWKWTKEVIEKAKWLSAFWGDVSNGRIPQRMTMFGGMIEWSDFHSTDMGPGLQANPEYFRTVREKLEVLALFKDGELYRVDQNKIRVMEMYEDLGGIENPDLTLVHLVEPGED